MSTTESCITQVCVYCDQHIGFIPPFLGYISPLSLSLTHTHSNMLCEIQNLNWDWVYQWPFTSLNVFCIFPPLCWLEKWQENIPMVKHHHKRSLGGSLCPPSLSIVLQLMKYFYQRHCWYRVFLQNEQA